MTRGPRSLFWKIYLSMIAAIFVPLATFAINTIIVDHAAVDSARIDGIARNLKWGARLAAELADGVGPDGILALVRDVRPSEHVDLFIVKNGKRYSSPNSEWSDDFARERGDDAPPWPMFARATSRSGETVAVLVVYDIPPLPMWNNAPHAIGILCVALIVVVIVYLTVRDYVASLGSISSVAVRIAGGDLSARVGDDVLRRGEEIAYLGETLNSMASRIESSADVGRRLLIDVSHEIRSPLQRIDVAIALARRGGDGCSSHLDRVEREIALINEMVGELLAYARAELPILEPTDVDLAEIVRSIEDDACYEGKITGRSITSSTEELTVSGDAPMLRRAISSVVENALRYTPPCSSIEISARADGDDAVVSVRDHGPGVPEGDIEMIFLPHYRGAASRERKAGGTGLGLSITKRVIEGHGGRVLARNDESGGLVVEMRIPLA